MKTLLTVLLLSQAASQPASQPSLPSGGSASDVTAQATVIIEVDEHHLKTQESWSLSNGGGKSVPASQLVFPLPKGSRRLSVDEDVPGFKGADDSQSIFADRDLGAGSTTFAAAYFWDFSGDTARFSRRIPVNVNGMRVIIEDIPGVSVSSNVKYQSRVRELNGLAFAIYDFAPITAGQTFQVTVSGLPSRATWPRAAALAITAGIVLWLIFSLLQKDPREATTLGPLSAQARRDQIIKALEILEADKAEGSVKPKRYARRHGELMNELAVVLREIDLARPGHGGG